MSLLNWWFTAAPPSASASTTPGYSIFLTPWMDRAKTVTGSAISQAQTSTSLGGGYVQQIPNAINDAVAWDIWLDVGTYKFSHIYYTNIDRGIYSVQLGGVTKGTIDGYAASGTENNYTEITGIVVSAAAINAFKLLMASKHASSSGYRYYFNSSAWIRTGA